MKHVKKDSPTARLLTALTLLAGPALAQAQAPAPSEEPTPRVLQANVSAGVERDDNVLRAPVAVSDEIGVFGAGLRLDKRYSLQRVTLDAQAREYRFRDFSNLDYRTLDYTGAWDFQVTPRLQGVLSATRRQYRDITDATIASAGVFRRTERRELAEVRWRVAGGWRALAGLARTSSRSDDPRALESSPRVDSARLGGGYEFGSGARLDAYWRRGDGRYERGAAGSDFRETEPTLELHWPASGHTALDLRVGRLERRHDARPERDFEGATGSATALWTYSPKTRLELGLARDLGSYEFDGGGFIRGWRWHLAPVWQASAKVTLRLRHAREARTWHVVSPASPDAGREDRTRWNSLGLEWEPLRALRLSAALRQERRTSSLAANDLRARIVALGVRLDF